MYGRIIGGYEKQKQRTENIKMKRKIDKLELDATNNAQITKPDQLYESPNELDCSYIFYSSLYNEDPHSILAISYLIYNGCFEQIEYEEAMDYLRNTKQKLLPVHTFFRK